MRRGRSRTAAFEAPAPETPVSAEDETRVVPLRSSVKRLSPFGQLIARARAEEDAQGASGADLAGPGEVPKVTSAARVASRPPSSSRASSAESVPPAGAPEAGLPFEYLGIYRVLRLLGRGGMGEVYEALDEGLDRRVALKVLAQELSRNDEHVGRFLGEARAVARVNHPNVVQVFYAGTDGARHYFAMEFVPGHNLQQIVQNEAPLTPLRTVETVTDAARGLRAAHEQGLIHRDVKPANLLRTPGGRIKITDFGLAKLLDDNIELTQAGAIMGTPQFMSPEQAQGFELDQRADIYSLGATMHFLLVGSAPYSGKDAMAVMLQHIREPAPQIRRAPPSINTLLRRMMAKNPAERFPDYDELLDHLQHLLGTGVLRDKPLDLDGTGLQDIYAGTSSAAPGSDSELLNSIDELMNED
jgi:serine/threonine protein kinase